MKLRLRNIKRLLSQLPFPFWVGFYIFLLLITLPVLAYLGTFGKSADLPPETSTDSASSVTQTTATLSGLTSPSGVTERGFQYGTDTNYGSNMTDDSSLSLNYQSQFGSEGSEENQLQSAMWTAIDSTDKIYVTDGAQVKIFNSSGLQTGGWTNINATSIHIDSDDNVWVTVGNSVRLLDLSGNTIRSWGSLGTGDGQFNTPTGVAVDENGNVYVKDTLNYRIQKFDTNGNFVSKWGSQGTGDGQFTVNGSGLYVGAPSWTYHGIAVDSQGNIYSADRNRIQKFDSDGTFLAKSGPFTATDATGITIDDNDRVYINKQFAIWELNQTNLSRIDSIGTGGSGNGQFSSWLIGIANDSQGRIYVVDRFNYRVQVFSGGIEVNLSGLSCNTTYHYRAFATNPNGTSYGEDQTFTTLACPDEFAPVTFDECGSEVVWEVPAGLTRIAVDIAGAQGGSAYTEVGGGLGGTVQTTLEVTPGQDLLIYVGCRGNTGQALQTSIGGWNGGGIGGRGAGGGGGASDIRIGSTGLNSRVIVAGAGGGVGADHTGGAGGGAGGIGGNVSGDTGLTSNGAGVAGVGNSADGGYAGNQTNGGWGGNGTAGTIGIGGSGGNSYAQTLSRGGGGGGGGYYGGGGGSTFIGDPGGGGGGGSSYSDATLTSGTIFQKGLNSGNGYITLSPADEPFIFRVDTARIGTEDNVFRLNGIDNTYTYNYNVDCDNDGTLELVNQTGESICTYPSPGVYDIAITGQLPRLYFNDVISNNKIIDVLQWGDIEWQSMELMFEASALQISATDAPDLTNVTSLKGMFSQSQVFNSDISNWDFSTITDMSDMFMSATAFNQPVNTWDVSNVTDMSYMFSEASAFNQPLDTWDVSNVTDMSYMFFGYGYESVFNQSLNSWNTSSVVNMDSMFFGADVFNQPLNSWNVSNVINMNTMLYAPLFDQPLGDWDMSNVAQADSMLYALSTENYDDTLIGWANQTLQSSVAFGAQNSYYCLAEVQRQQIIDIFGWTINDSGKDCSTGLGVPDNLEGFPEVMAIDVEWDDVIGATYYILEYKESSSNSWIEYSNLLTSENILESSLYLTGLEPSTSYDIRVRAADNDNNQSAWSNVLTVSTLAQTTYSITNCEELQAIFINRETLQIGDPTGRYVLQNDIDCSETIDWTWNEAFGVDEDIDMPTRGFFPMWCLCEGGESFKGTLDGQGYKITSLFQANPMQAFLKDGIATVGGLFGGVERADIIDVHLQDVTILKDVWFDSEFSYGVGGIAGTAYFTNFSGNSVTGLIDTTRPVASNGSAGFVTTGGIVGGGVAEFAGLGSVDNTVSKSYADVAIKLNSIDNPNFVGWEPIEGEWGDGDNFVPGMPNGIFSLSMLGGVMAEASGGSITNSYSLGSIEVTSNTPLTEQYSGIIAGGLLGSGFGFFGSNFNSIANSYSATSIDLTNSNEADVVGGLVGWGAGEIQNSFSAGGVTGNEVTIPDGGLLGAILSFEDAQVSTLDNNYYDRSRTDQSLCVGSAVEYSFEQPSNSTSPANISSDECRSVNPSNNQPNYFIDNRTSPPLNQWNFASIWRTNYNRFPDFVGSTRPIDPGGGDDPTNNPDPDNPGGGGSGGGTTTPPTIPTTPDTESSGNPSTTPGSSEAPLTTNLFVQGASMGPLERFIQSIPTAIARSIPWTILLLLIALSLYYVYLAYLEEERRKELRALIARFKTTQQARASYLDITSHYINTPLSVMQGTVQVLASKKAINEELNVAATSQLNKLSKQVQSLLAQAQQTSVGQGAVVASLERTTITSLITQPYVWVPLAVSYSLAILANFVFIQADKYEPSLITFSAQVGIAIVGMLAIVSSVYYWQRMKHAKRLVAEELELEKQYSYQQAEFISSAYETLSADLTALNVLGTTIVQHPQGKPFAEALAKLEKTIFKLETLGQLARNVPGQTWKTDVNQAIEAALTEARQVADAKQVTITTHIEPHLLANIGEAGLVHVIRAPLMNAIQFSSPGSKIEFTALPTENSIVLTTTDHGQGMDQATQDKLFQPFSRSSTEQFNYEGMGLDLYLTRVILEQYGGTIAASSRAGEGTSIATQLSLDK